MLISAAGRQRAHRGQRRLRRRQGGGRGLDARAGRLPSASRRRRAARRAAATILVVKALVHDEMRAERPNAKFAGFTDVERPGRGHGGRLERKPTEEVNGTRQWLTPKPVNRSSASEPSASPGEAGAVTDARRRHDPQVRGFASDNYAGVHPEVLAALALANGGHQVAYGADAYTEHLQEVFRGHFGPARRGFPVFNGTGANVIALQARHRALGRGDLRRVRAHPRRRVRRARAGRRAEAADRAHRGRQAHPRADRPAGVRLRGRAPGASRRSSRSPRPPNWAPATRPRRSRRSATTPTSWACPCTWTAPASPTPAASLDVPLRRVHHAGGGRHPVLRRHQERPAVRRVPSSCSAPTRVRAMPLPAQAVHAARLQDAIRRPCSSRRCSAGDLWLRSATHANAMARRLAAGGPRHRRGDGDAAGAGQRGLRDAAARGQRAAPEALPLLLLGRGDRRGALDVRLRHHRGRTWTASPPRSPKNSTVSREADRSRRGSPARTAGTTAWLRPRVGAGTGGPGCGPRMATSG